MKHLAWIALALAAVGAMPASAQPPRKAVISFDGTEVFCYLLKARGFTPIPEIDELADLEPRETIVIVFGQNQVLSEIRQAVGDWKPFLRAGGGLLIATDFDSENRLTGLGLTISGTPVMQGVPGAYKDQFACPLVKDFTDANPLLFEGLKGQGIATNRPSYVAVRADAPLRPAALLADNGALTGDPWQNLQFEMSGGRRAFFAATPIGSRVPGRAAVLAGHGLFTNGMLLQRDNDNFDFAVNCLRWLREGPDGAPRGNVLFVVDGQVIRSFDVGLKPPMPPIPTPTIAIVNQLLTGMDREGLLVRLLEDAVSVHRVAQVALVMLTVILLGYGAKKVAEIRYHPEGRSVAIAGPYAAAPEGVSLAAQRSRSQVERGGLWEEGRALAQQGLWETFAIPLGRWSADRADRPRLELRGGWLEALRMRRRFAAIWDLAERRQSGRYSWAELVRLTQDLQALRRAVHEGRLRLRD